MTTTLASLNKYKDLEEISIRDEMLELISGEDFGEQKFIPHVIRRLRRDESGNLKRCTCWNEVSNEGQIGCPHCEGIGSLWDESIQPGYTYFLTKKKLSATSDFPGSAGRSEKYDMAFISPYTLRLREGDRIYIPAVSDDGFFKYPFVMESEFFVINYMDFRLDNGRVEYSRSVLSKVK